MILNKFNFHNIIRIGKAGTTETTETTETTGITKFSLEINYVPKLINVIDLSAGKSKQGGLTNNIKPPPDDYVLGIGTNVKSFNYTMTD